jgi:ribosomal biogenesis protein LAS1
MASSVALLAETVGLPRSVVDIRHEAAHHELPSLQLLRLGARQALEWLRASYW